MQQDFSRIPQELKNLPYWLTWKYVQKTENSKPTKAPNNRPSSWPNNLLTFSDVTNEYSKRILKNYDTDGIGIVITGDLVGIDIDNIEIGHMPKEIERILFSSKNAYVEKSVSGKGFHIIGTCSNKKLLIDLFQNYYNNFGKRANRVELYAEKRFLTVSGDTIFGNYGCIDVPILLAWEYITGKSLFSCVESMNPETKKITKVNKKENKNYRCQPIAKDPADQKILDMPGLDLNEALEKMFENEPILQDVLENGYSAVPPDWLVSKKADDTNSGIDMKIAGLLSYWLYRYGPETIIEIMEQSAIYRNDKNENYLNQTVSKAYKEIYENGIFYSAVKRKKISVSQNKYLDAWLEQQKIKIKKFHSAD